MPYIEEKDRKFYTEPLDSVTRILGAYSWADGHVNYVITNIVLAWWRSAPRYLTIARIMGCLICVMFEFYRRVAAPYENQKIRDNGDVY